MDSRRSDAAASDLLESVVGETLASHAEMVNNWLAGRPKSWGYLAGKAVGAYRRRLGRDLSDAERRTVWARLWQALTELKVSQERR